MSRRSHKSGSVERRAQAGGNIRRDPVTVPVARIHMIQSLELESALITNLVAFSEVFALPTISVASLILLAALELLRGQEDKRTLFDLLKTDLASIHS